MASECTTCPNGTTRCAHLGDNYVRQLQRSGRHFVQQGPHVALGKNVLGATASALTEASASEYYDALESELRKAEAIA